MSGFFSPGTGTGNQPMTFFQAAPDQIVVGVALNPKNSEERYPVIDIFYDEQLSPALHLIIEEMVRQKAKPEVLFLSQQEVLFEIPPNSTYVIVIFRLRGMPPDLFDGLSLGQFDAVLKQIDFSRMQLMSTAESPFDNDEIAPFLESFAKCKSCGVRVYEKTREHPLGENPFEATLIEHVHPKNIYR